MEQFSSAKQTRNARHWGTRVALVFSFGICSIPAYASNLDEGCVISGGLTTHPSSTSGTLTGSSPSGNPVSGSFSSTFSSFGFNGAPGTQGGNRGLQFNFLPDSITNPDSFTVAYTVQPDAGSFLGQVVVCQSAYATNGNNEPSTYTISFGGGGTARLIDAGQVTRVRRSGILSSDFTSPLSSGDQLIMAESIGNGPASSGGGFVGPDSWALIIDLLEQSGSNTITVNKQACIDTITVPCSLTTTSSNVSGETFQEWITFDTIFVNENADLQTVKVLTSGNATPVQGDTVTFEITVTNNGAAQATNVSLIDLIPAGLNATIANGSTATGNYNAFSGLWSIGTLVNGASATLTIEGVVGEGQGNQTIENITTAATGDQPDPSSTGDDLNASVTIAPSTDLSITKTNTPGVNGGIDQANDTVTSGTVTTYTVVVTNNGPDSVTRALVTDTPSTGINCLGTNPVTITGDGVPIGSFTIADLTGPGIALARLNNGEETTLTYSCEVI